MNSRGSNQNSRPNTPMSYQQHSGTNNFVPQPQNPGGYTVVATTRNPRHYTPNDMKSNHMTNMQPHGQIQVIPTQQSISHRQTLSHHIRPNTPRNLPRGPYQYQVYLPGSMAYQGNNNHAYYPYTQQTSQAVLMPFMPNYNSNHQSNLYYSSATPRQPMVNIQQGLSNTPVANMSAAQNSHGPSLIVQPPPMEMPSNSQPLQVQQQQPSTPMQPPEPRPQKRVKNLIKITHPETGDEIDLHNTAHLVPSAVELKKMKVQSQFQSQVQSAVKKDDKASDDNKNIEGGEDKVRNEFASQVKKLATEPNSSGIEDDVPTKAIEVIEAQLPEEVTAIEELDVIVPIVDELPVENTDKTSTVDLTTNTEEVPENDKETNINALSISTPTHELPQSTTDIVNSEGTNSIKKSPEEESVKPAKPKKSKNKKKKNIVKETDETLTTNVQLTIDTEPVVTSTQENKENEFVLPNENEDISLPQLEKDEVETETKIIEIQPEVVKKIPSYLDKLPYAEGQWSTINQTGKKMYSKLFLLQLGNESICQKKPDILNIWTNITRSSNQPQYGSMVQNVPRSQSASAQGFLPPYFRPGSSQKGGMPIMPGIKRNSSQGKTASKTAKPNTIHMSLSLREEVKLNQTDNAWVPTVAKKSTKVDVSKNKDEEELKTEDVNKAVRSILNKITPENMNSMTLQFRELSIDTVERLEKTIDLVFEKAIEEQSFAPLYASLCASMQSVQVSSGEGGNKKTFKKLIISKCQSLFELDKAQEMDSAKKLSEINSCKDPEKKKVLQLDYEENERRLRKRSVGNCRFIGELFKQKILTPNIMFYCIVNLVTKHVEEPLECLCNLLKTVGKELDEIVNLNETFEKLKHLSSKEMKSKIPSRIRFMIQDIIDLRRDKWVPRRNDSKPKLINEIENDAKNEALEQSIALSSFNRQDKQRDHHRSDEKFRGGDSRDSRDNRDKNRRNDAEWNVVQNAKFKQSNYIIDQSKLLGIKESAVTTLGPSSKWLFSNNSSAGSKNSSFTSSNTFAALNDDKKSSTTSQMSNKNTLRKPVISETEERQRMMSGLAMMPQFAQSSTSNSISSQPSKEATTIDNSEADSDDIIAFKISNQCKTILLEYSVTKSLKDIVFSLSDEKESTIKTRKVEFVKGITLAQLESNPNSRIEAGKLFADLLSYKHKDNVKVLSIVDVAQGIDAVLKEWNDYLMDYPQFFSCIAAIITSLLISKTACFEISNLKDTCISICPDNSSTLFTEVIRTILSSKETQNIKEQVGGILWVYNKWRMSEYVPLNIFMPINQLNKYFKNDRVGVFLLSVTIYDKMRITDHKLFYELMSSWITSNINEKIIKCPQFMRALTIAIVMMCLKPNHSFEDFFDHGSVKLLTSFMGSKPTPKPEIQAREVQCLYGIQIMSAALEHPGGMVLKLFHKLYENSVISKESFEFWKKEYEFKIGFDEDLETKTMAVVVLNSFFLSLSINDSDDDDTADQ